ncbi:MAG: hypothetical protein WCJ17_03060 [bacterium]
MKKTMLLLIILGSMASTPFTYTATSTSTPPTHAPGSTPKKAEGERYLSNRLIALAIASTLGGAALWASSQHKHSKIGHERYPHMQRRNIIRARLAEKIDPSERETLKEELAEINYHIGRIHAKKSRLNATRIISGLVALAGLATTIYGLRKKKTNKK